jgi:hypothetical protein
MIFGLIATAYAQAATDPTTVDPGTQVVGWVCSNQTLMASIITIFGGRFIIELVSAGMKKFGVTSSSPGMAMVVPALRAISLDLKPPDHVIVQNAQAIVGPAVISDAVVASVKPVTPPPGPPSQPPSA